MFRLFCSSPCEVRIPLTPTHGPYESSQPEDRNTVPILVLELLVIEYHLRDNNFVFEFCRDRSPDICRHVHYFAIIWASNPYKRHQSLSCPKQRRCAYAASSHLRILPQGNPGRPPWPPFSSLCLQQQPSAHNVNTLNAHCSEFGLYDADAVLPHALIS